MTKRFSVVVITYNEEDYLPLLLDSIKNQSLQPYEIIVSDAYSKDKTREIAKAFGAKVVQGGLPSKGRNTGALAAASEYLCFFDADVCLTDPQFFQKAWDQFHKRDLELATADVYPLKGNAWDRFSHNVYNRYVRAWGARYPHIPGFCIFVKKSVHEQVKGFDESITFCEDHEYAQRVVRQGVRFGFFHNLTIPVSVRRMERDGRLLIAVKYILGELHFLLFGPIKHKRFNYTFGYGNNKKEK